MKVTKVIIRKLMKEGAKRAIASVTLDDELALHELTVVETDHLYVSFPSKAGESGNFKNIVHPINTAARIKIEGAVLKEYAHEMSMKNSGG